MKKQTNIWKARETCKTNNFANSSDVFSGNDVSFSNQNPEEKW